MLPTSLVADNFLQYRPEARAIAVSHLELFRRMPLSFLPSLLQELIEYDHNFPAERDALISELNYLSNLSPTQLERVFKEFAPIQVSGEQSKLDWVNQPLTFTEAFSANLWSTHQMIAFQKAAATYSEGLHAAIPAQLPVVPRVGIAVIGAGVDSYSNILFAQLRPHGTYFSNIQPEGGMEKLLAATVSRAESHPIPFGHWYVDGGKSAGTNPSLACVSYDALLPARRALLSKIQNEVSKPGTGPESLRNYIAHLQPEQLGLGGGTLDRFQMKLLTDGSGTQIFSTTFAQWTTREVLRRASATTLLVRFAPRQRQRPMNELLSNDQREVELDPVGSLVDADMAAYYQWINQQRLPGHDRSVFLVWYEGHRQALAIGPTLPRGVESKSALNLGALLAVATGT